MKRNFMKKALAVTLSAAMAFSLSSVNMMTASAASTVSMAKTKTVTVGETAKLKLKKNTKSWKITSASSRKPKYCKVEKVTSKAVTLTPKKETSKVTIRVRVKTNKLKKNNKKLLKCVVTVAGTNTPDPGPDPTPEVETKKTVTTQAELEAALADSNIKEITISTVNKESFNIAEGSHADVDLIVRAPESDVTNAATFKSITIESIGTDTWHENGKDNRINIKAAKAHVIIGVKAVVKKLLLAQTDANSTANVEVNGKVEDLTVNNKTDLSLGGTAENVPVNVSKSATDTNITATVKVELVTGTKISIVLEASAKGSSIKIEKGETKIDVAINNKTDVAIVITATDGSTVGTAGANSSGTVTAPEVPKDPSNPSQPSNPDSSTSNKLVNSFKVDSSAAQVSGTQTLDVTSTTITGSSVAATTTKGSISFTVSGLKTDPAVVTGSAMNVEYRAEAKVGENGPTYSSSGYTTGNATINIPMDCYDKTVTVTVYARASENDTYKAGQEKSIGTFTVTFDQAGTKTFTTNLTVASATK